MAVRDPHPKDRSFDATCKNLDELARAYCPILFFNDGEQFYPIKAESWLTHTTAAPWTEAEAEDDDVPADPLRRGTAIMSAGKRLRATRGYSHLGGPPNPHDRPILLDPAAAGDPDAIASYHGVNRDVFLDVGGWEAGGTARGNRDYLYKLFSELSCAMDPANPWFPADAEPNLPVTWVPQPVNPTVYAEVDWAGVHSRASLRFGNRDYPPEPESRVVDGYMVLTYHYLYPVREPGPGETGPRRMEGQWEAISLFFPAKGGKPDDTGRPQALEYHEPPEHVVVSRGVDDSQDQPFGTLHRRWNDVRRQHARLEVYVAAGSHRFYFDPTPGSRWDGAKPPPGSAGSNPDASDSYDADVPGFEPHLVAAAAAAVLLGPIVGGIVATILVILYLISVCAGVDSGDPKPAWQDTDHAAGDGPQAGTGEEPAAGGGALPGGPGATDPVTGTNAGSPTGRNHVSFDVRLVDALRHSGRATLFPSPKPCEYPAWWDYSGGWGVRVRGGFGADWETGTRRVDEYGRSWAYWNTLRVLLVQQGGSEGR